MKQRRLYNEERKQQFLDDKYQHDNKTYGTFLTMFEQLAADEYEDGMDLCDMHPKRYALLLIKYAQYNKYTTLRSRYNLLLIYREYCLSRNLINPILYYGNLKRFGENMSDRELYEIFDQHRKKYRKYFYNPKELYEFLFENLYDIKYTRIVTSNMIDHNFVSAEIVNNDPEGVITADELVVLYLCLLYYGVPKDKCCDIKNKDISIDEVHETITIKCHHEFFAVDFFLQPLIKRIMTANKILRNRNLTQTFIPKNFEYLLCYAEDDDMESRKKRNKRLSDKYYKDAERKGEDVISVKEIVDQGVIYRMCVLSYDHHYHPKTLQEHINLFKAVGGVGTIDVRSSRAIELRRMYAEHFDELYSI